MKEKVVELSVPGAAYGVEKLEQVLRSPECKSITAEPSDSETSLKSAQ